MFEHTVTARFRDIDYAGRVFYGDLFNFVHIAEEEWFRSMDHPIPELKQTHGALFPIVHADADFSGGIEIDDDVVITLSVTDISDRSFDVRAVGYNRTQGHDAFEIALTRVCIDAQGDTGSRSIPAPFREALEIHLES